MTGPGRFKPGNNPPEVAGSLTQSDQRAFASRLSTAIVDRFGRISGTIAVATLFNISDEPNQNPAAAPSHPECADHWDSDVCRRTCQSHFDEPKRRPESHWHRCPFGLASAVVPVTRDDHCLAILRLVCPGDVSDHTFERNVELLEILAENFLASEAELLSRWTRTPRRSAGSSDASESVDDDFRETHPLHPLVIRALEHIKRNLTDPTLTVADTARALNSNASYLAHLFVQQTGRRMGRHIATGRIELAKKLLTTTDWQIKRIAFKSGHANADWFSHVFHVQVGITPGEYRRNMLNEEHNEVGPAHL